SVSNHVGPPEHHLPPRQRVQRVSDFAMNERLVAAPPPNRVRSPTDRQFASGCSPRRFGPTQLPSATELWHTPARTFTVLMWRPHGRTHSRENGNPGSFFVWAPAFAGVMIFFERFSRNDEASEVEASYFSLKRD